jgi:hypothetical protein
MTVQTLKIGKERFVVIREKDYRELKASARLAPQVPTKSRRLSAQDRGDIAESKRRENEPDVSLETVRKRLGI